MGKAIALTFAEAGADVATCSRTDKGGELTAVADEVRKLGRRALAIQADVSRRADVDNMVKRTVAELGDIDILVNNAGIVALKELLDTEDEVWDQLFDINLKGCLLCAQEAGKRMIEQGRGGSIINLSSVAGIKAVTIRAGYASSKIGLIMLTKQLAIELGPHNIRVNAIAPGIVLTDLTRDMWGDPEVKTRLEATVPLGRWAEATEIANAALFLASDAGSYITGITLPIDGAMSVA